MLTLAARFYIATDSHSFGKKSLYLRPRHLATDARCCDGMASLETHHCLHAINTSADEYNAMQPCVITNKHCKEYFYTIAHTRTLFLTSLPCLRVTWFWLVISLKTLWFNIFMYLLVLRKIWYWNSVMSVACNTVGLRLFFISINWVL